MIFADLYCILSLEDFPFTCRRRLNLGFKPQIRIIKRQINSFSTLLDYKLLHYLQKVILLLFYNAPVGLFPILNKTKHVILRFF